MPIDTDQAVRHLQVPSAKFIFGSTPGMCELREKIARAVHDDLPVLIEGESGTGKDAIGQFMHTHSARKDGPFRKLSCAAVPQDFLEGEMFGYGNVQVLGRKNQSAGAESGGTLFLDQIASMDLSVQQKLAQVFKSGHYREVNGKVEKRVNVRFVGATHVDVEAASTNRILLAELLNSFAHRVRLLPLRDRKEDIPELCEYLVGRSAREYGRPVPRLSAHVLEGFQQWRWPGNIRELENWIARIVIFGVEEVMDLEFSRQLLASDGGILKRHHVGKMQMGRARRLRRHG